MLGIKITPLTQRRIAKFKADKKGYWSMWIFLVLFTVSLFSEFLANDKPFIIRYDNQFYFPIFQSYDETIFGGFLEGEADYKDADLQASINEKGWMIWPIVKFNYATIDYSLATTPAPPSSNHWLGTDDHGRDVVARLLYGFRISVLFGLHLISISSIIGILAGAIQGYFGGWVDLLGQRFIEIWNSMPYFYLLIIMASIIKPSFWWLLGLMCLFDWTTLVGVVRAEFLKTRNYEYVEAARALGVSNWKIIIRHILPNATVSVMTLIPFDIAAAVTALTSLDFIGFGLPPGSPSLGELLAQGKANLNAPWLIGSCFVCLGLMLVLLVFTGGSVRNAFDPRSK